jgi:hypothetical protein
MPRIVRACIVIGALAVAAPSCGGAGSRSTLAHAPDCVVEVRPFPPGQDYVEIGELSFLANAATGKPDQQYRSPYQLAADLHGQICAVGGDLLVTERNAAGVIVQGTVYRRADLRDVAPPPERRERGERCEGAGCARSCDPACGDGEACGPDQRCHPSG